MLRIVFMTLRLPTQTHDSEGPGQASAGDCPLVNEHLLCVTVRESCTCSLMCV